MGALDTIIKGKRRRPINVMVYGKDGIGKSSFAADAPRPIFIDGEESTEELDVERFPKPGSWQDVIECVDSLTSDRHDYETVVLDTLDWLEPLGWQEVIRRHPTTEKGVKVTSIDDYGFQKGQNTFALDVWRELLAKLERLRNDRGMNIVTLAHSEIKLFANPEGDDFDRYGLKLSKSLAGLMREWPDAVLFATHEIFSSKGKGERRAKGVGSGRRVLYTEERPAFYAKNRYGLPFELDLSWAEFYKHARGDDSELIATRILERFKETELRDRALKGCEQFKGNSHKLRQFENYLISKLPVTEETTT